jgi:hydroxymethylbilane synthase
MTPKTITIATRESPLALQQAHWVKQQLEHFYPNLNIHLLGMTTQADRMLNQTLEKIGGKGLFVKELEEALLDGRADLAVHSMKDVPMVLPEGLMIPVICERESPLDVLVSNQVDSLASLSAQALIGTSSVRRQSQLAAIRSDLTIVPLRGNVNTRLKKLDDGEFAAIILAAAGLKRLGLEGRCRILLPSEQMLPAPGQGALGLECRAQDEFIHELIQPLNHLPTQVCVTAERAMCQRLEGGCQTSIAAYAELKDQQVWLRGLVASIDGQQVIRAAQSGPIEMAALLGIKVAEDLLQQGALEILNACASHSSKTTR